MDGFLIFQHQADAPPGLVGDALDAAGARARTVRVDAEPLPAAPAAAGAVIVLGSDASAVGDGSAPWIGDEIAWLRTAAAAGVPVLGICFGAQVLAAALGGAVTRMPAPQVGWVDVGSTAPDAIPPGPWLAWHEDAVTPPPGARVLARDAVCVQAFATGPHLALQFHPEVTPAIVEDWVDAYGRDLAGQVFDLDRLLADTERHAARAAADARALFAAWEGDG
ncbi:MAG TPA: type 1 glutamine amidotransferase, partial [Solirubrobacteraceae bacterium]